jgi:hypothetical protein
MGWLTWQAVRALADAEVAKAKDAVRFVSRTDPTRPKLSVPLDPGCVLYARDSWRAPWRTSLKQVPVPCVLVTAFHDAHVQPHAREMFDGLIRRWFAVQVNTTHPRLTAMPIGIDGRDVPTFDAADRRVERDILLLANFQPRTPERKALTTWCAGQDWITTSPWRGPQPSMSVASYAALLGRSRFVLSPMGRGWDCYRTYEAIAMGAIPIVKRQRPLSDVVDGLPALVVDDWHQVTPERLRAYQPSGDTTRLTLAYWQAQIEGARYVENE